MDSILNQEDDEIYVYCSPSKEDAVKIKKRQVTAERLAIIFNVSYSVHFHFVRICIFLNNELNCGSNGRVFTNARLTMFFSWKPRQSF